MRIEEVHINIDRDNFLWTESEKVTKYFFKMLHDKEALFNEEALKKMARFYVGDVEKIYEASVVVSKNENPIKKGNVIDAYISMFIEGINPCHRISFYLNDYNCNGISATSKKLVKEKVIITKYALVESLSKAS